MLNWQSHEHITGALVADGGRRGTYVIERVGHEWLLTAVGHDGLSLLLNTVAGPRELPAGGKLCATLDAARDLANRLEAVPDNETTVSGA